MASPRASVAFAAVIALTALLAIAPAASGFVAKQTSWPEWLDAEAEFQPAVGVYDPSDPLSACLALFNLPPVGPLAYYATARLAIYWGVEVRNQPQVEQPLPPPLGTCGGLAPNQHVGAGDFDSHAGGVVWQSTQEEFAWCQADCTATYHVYEWSSCSYTHSSVSGVGLPGLATASEVACTNELCDPLVIEGRDDVHYGSYVWLHGNSSHEADGVPHLGLPDHGPHAHSYLHAYHLCEPEEEVGGAWADRNAIVQVCLEGDFWDIVTGLEAPADDQDHFALLNTEADPLDTLAFLQATVLDPSTWSNLEPDVGC